MSNRAASLVADAAAKILVGNKDGMVFEWEANSARELLELALRMVPRPIVIKADGASVEQVKP